MRCYDRFMATPVDLAKLKLEAQELVAPIRLHAAAHALARLAALGWRLSIDSAHLAKDGNLAAPYVVLRLERGQLEVMRAEVEPAKLSADAVASVILELGGRVDDSGKPRA